MQDHTPFVFGNERVIASMAAALFAFALSACGPETPPGPAANSPPWTPVAIELDSGDRLEGEEGSIIVPERRGTDDPRKIAVGFRRFASASSAPGPPVFMLAGGPGRSYNEQLDEGGQRQKDVTNLITLFRQAGDVILVDLRGVYLSKPNILCDGPRNKFRYIATADQYGELFQDAGSACREKLNSEGFDLLGYNVLEAGADVITVADALGYGQIRLYGASFGSHWALAIAKLGPNRVSAMVLDGVEGFDHTFDDPQWVRSAVQRIANEASTAWGGHYGSADPYHGFRTLTDRAETSQKSAFGLSRTEVEQTLLNGRGYSLFSRRDMAGFPQGVAELLDGRGTLWLRLRRPLIGFGAKGLYGWDGAAIGLFDCSSHVSDERKARLTQTAERGVVDDLRFYDAYCKGWGVPALPDAFRTHQRLETKALLYAGTFDVSTPIENARDVARQLPNGQLVVVARGSHRAFSEALEHRPHLATEILAWLAGGPPPTLQETLPPVRFDPVE